MWNNKCHETFDAKDFLEEIEQEKKTISMISYERWSSHLEIWKGVVSKTWKGDPSIIV